MLPEFYGFHTAANGDRFINDNILVNLDKPTNHKEAMADPEAAKWKEAIDIKIQYMYDNQVWTSVDYTPGRKIVG